MERWPLGEVLAGGGVYLATVNTPSLNLEDNVSLSGNVESVSPQGIGDLWV